MIKLENVNKYFGDLHVLKDVNLEVKEGEKLVIIGPSGSGKSTTVRCMNFLEEPTSGHVYIDGKELTHKNRTHLVRETTSMVFQQFNLYPHMTVLRNLTLAPMKLHHKSRKEAEDTAFHYLDVVGLRDKAHAYPSTLSGGQQQRIAIARSLLLKPSLLLLDEPFSALDAKIRQQMREELKRIQSELGITVIFVTHDQEEAMAVSHRIVVMNKGKFDQVGTPDEIYDYPATLHVASFIGEMNFIKQDGVTLAVRPEDLTVTEEKGDMQGVVSTVMLMGHYVQMTAMVGDDIVKCFINRNQAEQLKEGNVVNLKIGKHTQFPMSA